jgi:ABC-2 type transport system permease protein
VSALRGTLALFRGFLTEATRSRASLFWTLAFPLLFLFVFGFIFVGGRPNGMAYLLPGLLTISVMSGSFFGVAFRMVVARENGVLRRLRVTPVSALAVVVAYGLVALVLLVATVLLQIGVAKAVWRFSSAGSWWTFAAVALVGSAARDMRSAPPVANLIFFPMMFVSGAAVPFAILPPFLQAAGRVLPSSWLVEALQGVLVRGDGFGALAAPVAVLVATGLAGLGMNSLLFRWESAEPVDRRKLAFAIGLLALLLLAVGFLAPPLKMRHVGWGGAVGP